MKLKLTLERSYNTYILLSNTYTYCLTMPVDNCGINLIIFIIRYVAAVNVTLINNIRERDDNVSIMNKSINRLINL